VKAPNYGRGLLIVSAIALTILASPYLLLWAACVFAKECV